MSLPPTDRFSRPMTWVLSIVAAATMGFAVYQAISGHIPPYPYSGEGTAVYTPEFPSERVAVTSLKYLGALMGSLVFGYVLPILLGRRVGNLEVRRTIEPGHAPVEVVLERMAAKLIDAGYGLAESLSNEPDKVWMVLRPGSTDIVASSLQNDIGCFDHEVVLTGSATGAEGIVRFTRPVIDSGESEFGAALLAWAQSGESEFVPRRTMHNMVASPVWMAAVATAALGIPLGRFLLLGITGAYAALGLILVLFNRRRTYGMRFALMALAVVVIDAGLILLAK